MHTRAISQYGGGMDGAGRHLSSKSESVLGHSLLGQTRRPGCCVLACHSLLFLRAEGRPFVRRPRLKQAIC